MDDPLNNVVRKNGKGLRK